MARMYPGKPVVNKTLGSIPTGEKEIFNILRDKLPDSWIVMHSVRESMGAINYEADFVILVPYKGILVLEVKSHKTIKIRDGCWMEYHTDTGEYRDMEKHTPLDQAFLACKQFMQARTRDRTIAVIKDKHQKNCYSPRLRYTYAAVLTNIETFPKGGERVWERGLRDACLVPEDHYICGLKKFQEEDLTTLFSNYFGTEGWQENSKPWYSPDFNEAAMRNIRSAVKPCCDLESDPELYRINLEYAARRASVLLEATANSNVDVSIKGCAGSGKTVMLVKEAKRLYRQALSNGKKLSILILCYNRNLAKHLKEQFADCPIRDRCNIEIDSFLSFAVKELSSLDPSWNFRTQIKISKQDLNTCYAIAIQKFASIIFKKGKAPRQFDHIFVDEAQDFEGTWFCILPAYRTSLTPNNNEGRIYYFSDSNQTLYKGGDSLPDTPMKINLLYNLRNAWQIALFNVRPLRQAGLKEHELPVALETLHGRPVAILEEADVVGRKKKLEQLIKSLLEEDHVNPADIAILSPYRKSNANNAFTDIYPKLRFSTIRSFKGLEADYVILTDIAPVDSADKNDPQSLGDFYVAASRAKFALYILPAPGGKEPLETWLKEAKASENITNSTQQCC